MLQLRGHTLQRRSKTLQPATKAWHNQIRSKTEKKRGGGRERGEERLEVRGGEPKDRVSLRYLLRPSSSPQCLPCTVRPGGFRPTAPRQEHHTRPLPEGANGQVQRVGRPEDGHTPSKPLWPYL